MRLRLPAVSPCRTSKRLWCVSGANEHENHATNRVLHKTMPYSGANVRLSLTTLRLCPPGQFVGQRSRAADCRHPVLPLQGPQSAEDVSPDRHQDGLGRHHQGGRVWPGARTARLYRGTGAGISTTAVLCTAVEGDITGSSLAYRCLKSHHTIGSCVQR